MIEGFLLLQVLSYVWLGVVMMVGGGQILYYVIYKRMQFLKIQICNLWDEGKKCVS